ncbi:MAG: CRTAC1 family protein [Planctomycetes bacterium]|nr:CRTAC1 family protein [Planctomycetota bacterium]
MNRGPASVAACALAGLLGPAPAASQIVFTDAAREAGIRFRHTDGGCGSRWFAEQVGSGVAFIDADGDGRLDLYFPSGVPLPGCPEADRATSRFFRNAGGGRFADATDASGLGEPGYATGCAAGDVDSDGDEDLFVACLGPDRLYRNERGRFADSAAEAGVADPAFGSSASFLDYDRDGDLDLYVASYVEVETGKEKRCTRGGLHVYCLPQDYPGAPDRLYRNDGRGRFTDVTPEAGVLMPRGRGLGVAVGDYDSDGWPDIYVANDTNENHLFRNLGDGTFLERGLEAGVAVSENGVLENGMGTDWGDWSGDGLLDLVVTNFDGQTNALYRSLGGGLFEDVSFASGTGEASLPYVGWASVFADLDSDGLLDLFVTNGHVFDNVARFQEGAAYAQPSLVHRNLGNGRFATRRLDRAASMEPRVGRGAAAGDYDGDGDLDIAVSNLNAEPFLLRNDSLRAGRWLGLRLAGTRSNRSAIGARVELRAGGRLQVREVKSGSGYLSQGDLRLLFGLGDARSIDSLVVRWPSGRVEDAAGRVILDAYVTLVEPGHVQ